MVTVSPEVTLKLGTPVTALPTPSWFVAIVEDSIKDPLNVPVFAAVSVSAKCVELEVEASVMFELVTVDLLLAKITFAAPPFFFAKSSLVAAEFPVEVPEGKPSPTSFKLTGKVVVSVNVVCAVAALVFRSLSTSVTTIVEFTPVVPEGDVERLPVDVVNPTSDVVAARVAPPA